MKTIEIFYKYGESIEVEIPRKKKGEVPFMDTFVRGDYHFWRVRVVKGLDDFVDHVIKNADDYKSNGGKWYAHCNGYCMDAIVDYNSKETGIVSLNSYFNYRKTFRNENT